LIEPANMRSHGAKSRDSAPRSGNSCSRSAIANLRACR
jgi:hypothetical protein